MQEDYIQIDEFQLDLDSEREPKPKITASLHYRFDENEHEILKNVVLDLHKRYASKKDVLRLTYCFLDNMQVKSELYTDLISYILNDIYEMQEND